MMNRILHGDCFVELSKLNSSFAHMVYIDPPFNTGKVQKRKRIRTTEDAAGYRTGFGGKRYNATEIKNDLEYEDSFKDYSSFLMSRIESSLHCLRPNGSLFVHLDYREVHYIKVALDILLGRDKFMNEIIWAYDYGGRSKSKWSCKHDTILWYALNPKNYIFNFDAMERIPYMAPELAGAEKAARGKTPTDVFWHTIVPTNGKEKTGYPTQKPLGLLNRLVKVHTDEGDTVLDFFAGSGTTGEAAAMNGRSFTLIDESSDAIAVMKKRLAKYLR